MYNQATTSPVCVCILLNKMYDNNKYEASSLLTVRSIHPRVRGQIIRIYTE